MNTISINMKILAIALVSIAALSFFATPAFADHGDEPEVTTHATTAGHHSVVTTKTMVSQATLDGLKKQLEALISLAKSKGFDVRTKPAETSEDAHHAHDSVYEAGDDAPTLSVEVHEGGMGGYAVFADTTLTFAPLKADTEHVDGEGHAHIYVDGVKISRMYGPWFYLAPIKEKGTHTISVELSTNNHMSYAEDGEKVTDSAEVIVK